MYPSFLFLEIVLLLRLDKSIQGFFFVFFFVNGNKSISSRTMAYTPKVHLPSSICVPSSLHRRAPTSHKQQHSPGFRRNADPRAGGVDLGAIDLFVTFFGLVPTSRCGQPPWAQVCICNGVFLLLFFWQYCNPIPVPITNGPEQIQEPSIHPQQTFHFPKKRKKKDINLYAVVPSMV